MPPAVQPYRLPPAILAVCPDAAAAQKTARDLFARAACARGGSPCGTCPPCRSLAANTHPDWIEVDEEERGVETLRELLRRLALAPAGPVRIVYIPRVESLSPEGAAVLLKAIEDPPDATTFYLHAVNPLRVLPTIRSRAHRVALPRTACDDPLASDLARAACDGKWERVARHLGGSTPKDERERLLAAAGLARAAAGKAGPEALLRLAAFSEALSHQVAPRLAAKLLAEGGAR